MCYSKSKTNIKTIILSRQKKNETGKLLVPLIFLFPYNK